MGLMPVAVIAFGGALIMQGRMNYIDLITFTLYVSAFITPVRRMSNFAEVFANGMAGLRRFGEIMAIQPQVPENQDAPDINVTDGRIDIDDISFSYDEHTEVLSHVDLHIERRQIGRASCRERV